MNAQAVPITPPAAPPSSSPAKLFLTQMYPSPTNPRKTFDKAKLAELTESIKRHGVLQPILVRLRAKKGTDAAYEIVAGESRWRASKDAALAEVPVIVHELADGQVLEIQLEENLRRSDLHALDEAEGYQRLMAPSIGYSLTRVMETFNRSEVYIKDRLRLLALSAEAQEVFRSGRILLGHAVALARLTPQDQKRAIGSRYEGGLWDAEELLFDDDAKAKGEKFAGLKAKSVRELEQWITANVRIEPTTATELQPELFPQAAKAVTAAVELLERVVELTTDDRLDPKLKPDGKRIYGPAHWKRADGAEKSKTCASSVTGIIVIGEGRGAAFKVCIDKRHCETHWESEQRAAKKAAAGGGGSPTAAPRDTWKEQEERRKRETARFDKAKPAIMKALVDAVKKLPVKATGQLADELLDAVCGYRKAAKGAAAKLLARGSSAEDLVRFATVVSFCRDVEEGYHVDDFKKRAKEYGVDVTAIVDKVAPKETPKTAAPPAKASSKKKGAKK